MVRMCAMCSIFSLAGTGQFETQHVHNLQITTCRWITNERPRVFYIHLCTCIYIRTVQRSTLTTHISVLLDTERFQWISVHNLRLNMSITSLVCTSYIIPISTHVKCNRHHYTAPSSMYMYTYAHQALPTICCVTGCVNLCQLFTQHGNQTSENPSLSQDGNLLHRTWTSGDLHQVHNTWTKRWCSNNYIPGIWVATSSQGILLPPSFYSACFHTTYVQSLVYPLSTS